MPDVPRSEKSMLAWPAYGPKALMVSLVGLIYITPIPSSSSSTMASCRSVGAVPFWAS